VVLSIIGVLLLRRKRWVWNIQTSRFSTSTDSECLFLKHN
jgi:hypothetical protein